MEKSIKAKKEKTIHLVSRKQALALRKLGFDAPVAHYLMTILEEDPIPGKRFNTLCVSYPCNWNDNEGFISVPTVYEALDWLKSKYQYDVSLYICVHSLEVTRYKRLREEIDEWLRRVSASKV